MKTDDTNLEQNLDQKCGCDEVLQNKANLDPNHAENMAKNNVDCAHSSAQTDEQISTTNSDEIVKIQSELDEITDKFVRAQADFTNIKKRLERENSENLEYANMKFAKDLLPILDALEIAATIDVGDSEIANKVEEGIKNCVNMFLKTFENYGIVAIKNDGEADPNFHQVIKVEECENATSGHIVQVFQKGYTFKNRLLRESIVATAK